jgi:hypothetical protein
VGAFVEEAEGELRKALVVIRMSLIFALLHNHFIGSIFGSTDSLLANGFVIAPGS